MKFFWWQEIFYMIFISEIAVKMNLRIIKKNHAADPEIEFLAKLISKSNRCATAMPTAWELNKIISAGKMMNNTGRLQCHYTV